MAFYFDFMEQFSKNKSANILVFGIIPYISLFTIESYRYIQKILPHYAIELPKEQELIIRASRVRIKLFDDSNNKVDGTFDLLDEIAKFHEDLYRDNYSNMGIFFYGNHIIGSTHTGLFLSGLRKIELLEDFGDSIDRIGQVLHTVSRELGKYLGWVKTLPEFQSVQTNCFKYDTQDFQLYYQDVKSEKFLSLSFNKTGNESINYTLLLFLSMTNFIDHLFIRVKISHHAYSLFKIKFIMLYHLASSLERLQNYGYPKNILSDDSKVFLKTILKNEDLKMIKSKTTLRNIFVHYKIETKILLDFDFSSDFNFKSLVEYFFNGYKFEEIDNKVNSQIKRISLILEEWLNWSLNSSEYSQF